MKLVYSEESVADLLRLREFIAQWSPIAATRTAKELVARVENIQQFPEMGRCVVQAPDPDVVRDAVFGNYVVRYVAHADVVAILRIWHHLENRSGGG